MFTPRKINILVERDRAAVHGFGIFLQPSGSQTRLIGVMLITFFLYAVERGGQANSSTVQGKKIASFSLCQCR